MEREGTNGSTCNLQTHAELLSQEKKTGKKEATRYAIFSARCFVFLSCAFFHSIVPNSTHTHRHTHSLTLAKKRKPLTSIPLSIKWISTLLSNLKKEKERRTGSPTIFFRNLEKSIYIRCICFSMRYINDPIKKNFEFNRKVGNQKRKIEICFFQIRWRRRRREEWSFSILLFCFFPFCF